MLQVVLCGALMSLPGSWLAPLSWLVPSRWAYAMCASTVDLNRVPTTTHDSLWDHTARTWIIDACALGALGLILLLVTAILVHRPALRSSGG
jgi:hypothetical protein